MSKHTIEERLTCSSWHLFIAAIGITEFKNNKTRLSKLLSAGLILFHLDGAIADIIDEKSLFKRVFDLINETHSKDETSKVVYLPKPESR